MKPFVYNIPVKVYFGEGQLSNLGRELSKYGKKVLLTYGGGSIKKIGLYDEVIKEIKSAGLEVFELSGIEPNPRIESVREGARICKEENIDVVLAVGGGSTIDASKFICAGAKVDFDPWDFLDLEKRAKIEDALPLLTILTLSATGSEMDNGGVISNLKTNEKLSNGSMAMLPKVSFLDPKNTYSVSEYQTACGSADILSHILEVYFTTENDLFMLDCVMEGLMKTVIKYAPIAMKDPTSYEARANLMWASSWAINGFINGSKSTAWSCHPMEHELSAFYDITHGHGLAILTPRWMQYCLNDENIYKYVQFGVNVFGIDKNLSDREIAEKAIEKLSDFLFNDLKLQSTLTDVNINDENFAIMAKKACKGKESIKGFKELTPEDIENIYRMCL